MHKRESKRQWRGGNRVQRAADLLKGVPSAGGTSNDVERSGGASEESKRNTVASDDFFKAIEKIPVVGASLVFIIKKWGVPGLILFASGALFILGLIGFGVLPERLVSEKYKKNPGVVAAPLAAAPKTIPRSIEFDRIESADDWVQMLKDLLEREGYDKQQANPQADYQFGVGAFQYRVEQRNEQFTLVIKANPNFKISGRAFRQTKDSFIQPLRYETDEQELLFVVPECEIGDRLILLIRAGGEDNVKFDDVRSTFRPFVKEKS
jgi:hypothetical protein